MITLQNWLADRKRKYADGLALFQALAPEEMRKKYIAFFSEVKEFRSSIPISPYW